MFKNSPRLFALLLLLLLLSVSSLAVKAQTSSFRPVEQPKTPNALQAALPNQVNLCPEETKSLSITVSGGPPNLQVTYNLTQNPAGILGLSTSATGPFTDQLSLTFTLDYNGNGQSTPFYFKGAKLGQTFLSACSPQMGCVFNPQDVAVIKITSLVIEAINSPLDNNPKEGGGKRIYPDRLVAVGDTANRKLVKIKATLSLPRSGVTIFFRSFDVDDPSTDDPGVDSNGPGGDDNFGGPAQCGNFSASNSCDTSLETDANGDAGAEFAVTMQPGDNFKFAASCNSGYLTGVKVATTDLKDADGKTLPTEKGQATEMLTVWRHVHIEVDSMGPVVNNHIAGKILSVRRHGNAIVEGVPTPFFKLTVDVNMERERFEQGRIVIEGIGSFRVPDNSQREIDVYAAGVENAANHNFVMYDDDNFTLGKLPPDGDEGKDIPAPDTSFLQVSDDPHANVFAPAYVMPRYDVGIYDTATPFWLNAPGEGSALVQTYKFDAIGTEADPDFWTVYILGAYQYIEAADGDPDKDRKDMLLGSVDAINGVGASLFFESWHEPIYTSKYISYAATTAHEIGHLFGGRHEDGGLMAQTGQRTSFDFSLITLKKIRTISHP